MRARQRTTAEAGTTTTTTTIMGIRTTTTTGVEAGTEAGTGAVLLIIAVEGTEEVLEEVDLAAAAGEDRLTVEEPVTVSLRP